MDRKEEVGGDERGTVADGAGTREWTEVRMGGEKERGWMRGRLRRNWMEMGREGAGEHERYMMRGQLTAPRRRCKEKQAWTRMHSASCGKGMDGNDWGEGLGRDARGRMRGQLRQRGRKGMDGDVLGWGEGFGEDERAWMRGRLRTVCGRKGLHGNGWGKEARRG
eukprot:s847_g36.t1